MKKRKWIFDFKEYKRYLIYTGICSVLLISSLFIDEFRNSEYEIWFLIVVFSIMAVNNYRNFNTACENERLKEKQKEIDDFKARINDSIGNTCITEGGNDDDKL